MIRAVVFDFNGVLIDDESIHFRLFQEVLAAENVAITERMYHEIYLGLDDRGCFEAALRDADKPFTREFIDALIARKAVRYFEEAAAGLRIFPNAPETVFSLSEQKAVAVCSGALRPEIEFALNLMGVRERVFAIVSAEDTEYCKPDPQGYRLAHAALLAKLPDLAPGQCVAVEDSLAGIASAKGAGMRAVGVTNTYSREQLLEAGADAVLDDLGTFRADWIESTFSEA